LSDYSVVGVVFSFWEIEGRHMLSRPVTIKKWQIVSKEDEPIVSCDSKHLDYRREKIITHLRGKTHNVVGFAYRAAAELKAHHTFVSNSNIVNVVV